jgi:hypothetical protein
MKKITAILFAAIILLTGMHFSFATHICSGELAAVRWSFSGKMATCGMESIPETCPTGKGISSNCCSNDITFLKVDENYKSVSVNVYEIAKKIVQVYLNPMAIIFYQTLYLQPVFASISPPNEGISNTVNLADICIFRI